MKNWSQQISSLKNGVINAIVGDEAIVEMIDNPNITDADELIYQNIWDSWRVPETELWKETHICIKCDASNPVGHNGVTKNIDIWVLIMTHQDLQRVPSTSVARGCNRIDFISQRVEDLFNRNTDLGLGETTLISNLEAAVDSLHPCRELRFRTTGYNSGYDC